MPRKFRSEFNMLTGERGNKWLYSNNFADCSAHDFVQKNSINENITRFWLRPLDGRGWQVYTLCVYVNERRGTGHENSNGL